MGKRYSNDQLEETQAPQKGLFEKFLNVFGFEAEEIIEDEEAAALEDEIPVRKEPKERGKLLPLTNSNKPVKMVVSDPATFDEVQGIVDHLKNKRAVVLNLEDTDKAIARRIADFLSGAVYALEGSMQKISNSSIFLLTPAHIEVSLPLRTELKDKERFGNSNPGSSTPSSSPLSSSFFRNDRDDRR